MKRPAVLLVSLLLGGCQLGYYGHLVSGHRQLMAARVPVAQVLEDPQLSPEVRHKLELSRTLRDFAATALALPVEDAYRDYVPLGRDWATWNLFAAPPLSLAAKQWCYPIVGCASYRGYFDQQRADRDADKLRASGLEVYAGGAIAYSTLGWFDDPLTTPMLAGSDAGFAELLFHELAHRRFYLKGDTRFNESLATAVGRAGARQWLVSQGQDEAQLLARFAEREAARQQVLGLVDNTRDALARLYQSDLDDTEKRQRRDQLRGQLRRDYLDALAATPLLARYRHWFDGPLNNAQLATLADYEALVPGFNALLEQCQQDWACFWQAVERIAAEPAEQRNYRLENPDA